LRSADRGDAAGLPGYGRMNESVSNAGP
jgi:hypothetical protein